MSDVTSEDAAVSKLEAAGFLDHDPADPSLKDREMASPKLLAMLEKARKGGYPGWNPEREPQIFGMVADILPGCNCGEYGEHYIINIDTPSGRAVGVHCFHRVLRSQIERAIDRDMLVAGDDIAISYNGTKPSRKEGYSDQNDYGVAIDHKVITTNSVEPSSTQSQ